MRGIMPLELRSPEWVALGFFVYLAVAASLMRLPADRKRRVIRRAMLISAFILAMALPGGVVAARIRDGLPLVYLLLGYWLPVHLVKCTDPRLERDSFSSSIIDCLVRTDWHASRSRAPRLLSRAPRARVFLLLSRPARGLHLAGSRRVSGRRRSVLDGDPAGRVLLLRPAALAFPPAPRVRLRSRRRASGHRAFVHASGC